MFKMTLKREEKVTQAEKICKKRMYSNIISDHN
jgi:hypothetical protein